jgi:hypothetical protein
VKVSLSQFGGKPEIPEFQTPILKREFGGSNPGNPATKSGLYSVLPKTREKARTLGDFLILASGFFLSGIPACAARSGGCRFQHADQN